MMADKCRDAIPHPVSLSGGSADSVALQNWASIEQVTSLDQSISDLSTTNNFTSATSSRITLIFTYIHASLRYYHIPLLPWTTLHRHQSHPLETPQTPVPRLPISPTDQPAKDSVQTHHQPAEITQIPGIHRSQMKTMAAICP